MVSKVYLCVVDYPGPVNQWNEDKREEFRQCQTFRIEQGGADGASAGHLICPGDSRGHVGLYQQSPEFFRASWLPG